LGLNLGGTWHTSDVTNKTNIGYGFTIGRTYNFNYGKRLSFDIRGRYLTGNWKGQDKFLTARTLSPVSSDIDTVINNFQTQQHRLGLELVLRANGLRDRTGIDAYVFGGVGLTWHNTFADFKDTSNALYAYDINQIGQSSYLNSIQDGQFETALVGEVDKNEIHFMPSLGFGIGYQVGKRTTIGIEHKTTFTMRDDFDGFSSLTPNAEKDLYHYTSLYLHFRFKQRKGTSTGGSSTNNTVGGNNSVNNVGNYNQTNTACPSPSIVFISPAQNTVVSAQTGEYQLQASISNIDSRNGITFRQNGQLLNYFAYNTTSDRLDINLTLIPGVNTFEIAATNNCGSANQVITMNYTPCILPKIQFNDAPNGTANVSQALFSVNANLTAAETGAVTVMVNGMNIVPSGYIKETGTLRQPVTLSQGRNTIVVSTTNSCGTVSETLVVNYENCILTKVNLITPSQSGTSVTTDLYSLTMQASNVSSAQQLALTINNQQITNYTFNPSTGMLTRTLVLQNGTNTISLRATNNCGTDVKTLTILFNPPVPVTNRTVTICHYPTPGSNKPVTITIPENELSMHLAHGDQLGACTQLQPPAPEQKITICHIPPGNPNNPQTIEIPMSAWPAHQAHGDQLGACQPVTPTPPSPPTPPTPVPNRTVTICHYPTPGSNKPVTITIPENELSMHLAHGDQLGACTQLQPPAPEQKMTICHIPPGNPNNPQTIEIPMSAWPAHQAHGDQLGACQPVTPTPPTPPTPPNPPAPEQKITICHIPPGNPNNPQTIEIPMSAWPAHQAHGDQLGACQPVTPTPPTPPTPPNPPAPEQKITICHIPPGNPNNPQTIEIPMSAWPAHQAHGDQFGACQPVTPTPPTPPTPPNPPAPEQKITICHIPPGNPNNPQTIEIPMSAWPAHQAHGDQLGACKEPEPTPPTPPAPPNPPAPEQKITICHIPPGNPNNPQTIEIPMSAWPAHQAHGDQLGACKEPEPPAPPTPPTPPNPPAPEQKMTICHIPPGNPNNPQTIEIPMSAWPAHQAHGDQLGACKEPEPTPPTPPTPPSNEKITICHREGATYSTLTILASDWPIHQAHGDQMGPCPTAPNPGGGNGNDGKVETNGNSNGQGNGNGKGKTGNTSGGQIQKPGTQSGNKPVNNPKPSTNPKENKEEDNNKGGGKQIEKPEPPKPPGRNGG
jgi:hypothetical protein